MNQDHMTAEEFRRRYGKGRGTTRKGTGHPGYRTPQVWSLFGIPEPTREHRFHPTRKWRFDFAWIDMKICLEVEGGSFQQGRHNRTEGFMKDMQKYNAAAVIGWIVLRCTPQQLPGVDVASMLQAAMRARGLDLRPPSQWIANSSSLL